MTRIALRCDGDAELGAGHVGRCLPIARALRDAGAEIVFVGRYDGVAAWLLERRSLASEDPREGPCGLDAAAWSGAVVDLYRPRQPTTVCDLAAVLPIATVGEATRCADAGVWIDYHARQRAASDGPRRLGGPRVRSRRPALRRRAALQAEAWNASSSWPAGRRGSPRRPRSSPTSSPRRSPEPRCCAPQRVAELSTKPVTALPTPVDLAELAPSIDLAVVAAGMTAYELAAPGFRSSRSRSSRTSGSWLDGCRADGDRRSRVDGIDARSAPERHEKRSSDCVTRDSATASRRRAGATFDGRGAERIAKALLSAWTDPDTTGTGR